MLIKNKKYKIVVNILYISRTQLDFYRKHDIQGTK